MSENAKRLWESIKADSKAELSRLGTQGAMELASALFKHDAFVPYGPGQYTPSEELQQEHQGPEHQHEIGIER